MVLTMYLEYLWAAEWVDDSTRCQQELAKLPFLELLDCCRRYSFSDSMVRGRNLAIYATIGGVVAIVYSLLERDRLRGLLVLLAASSPTDAKDAKAFWAVRYLAIYRITVQSSFVGVLLLVPFHIDRPRFHYPAAGALFTLMFVAITSYIMIPLGIHSSDWRIAIWARRRQQMLPWMVLILVVQCIGAIVGILRVVAIVVAPRWTDLLGRTFGIFEVGLIIGYQVFVALFAADDVLAAEVVGRETKFTEKAHGLLHSAFASPLGRGDYALHPAAGS